MFPKFIIIKAIYPAPSGDQYATVPGVDLGLPSRQYPSAGGDEYGNVPGVDLGAPDRVYPAPSILIKNMVANSYLLPGYY